MNRLDALKVCTLLALVMCVVGRSTVAEPRFRHERDGDNSRHEQRDSDGGDVMDHRFKHDHAYPRRGAEREVLPRGTYTASRWRGRYFYNAGIWYRPHGPRFVVVAPPIGIVVPLLPPFYSTLWIGGYPYYYANDTYYAWRPEQRGYEVVSPPGDSTVETSPPVADEIYIYPRNGQNEQQQATDRYECHHWAVTQTSYDPTQPSDSALPATTSDKRADYHRAMAACLDARGYSVK